MPDLGANGRHRENIHMKVTRWRVADGETHIRKGAWEVCIPVGNGDIDTITFSGPNAAGRSARYAEQHGDWREGAVQDEDDISDLLA